MSQCRRDLQFRASFVCAGSSSALGPSDRQKLPGQWPSDSQWPLVPSTGSPGTATWPCQRLKEDNYQGLPGSRPRESHGGALNNYMVEKSVFVPWVSRGGHRGDIRQQQETACGMTTGAGTVDPDREQASKPGMEGQSFCLRRLMRGRWNGNCPSRHRTAGFLGDRSRR